MWTLQMFSGQKFRLNDEQADMFQKAVANGGKIIRFRDLLLSTTSFESLVSDQEMQNQKYMNNPIINDQDFTKWLETGLTTFAQKLDSRYPEFKYKDKWEEAREYRRKSLTEKEIIKSS